MAATPSTMLPLGTPLPHFELPDTVSGETFSSSSLEGQHVLLAVICNHCPFVIHLKRALAAFAAEYAQKGIKVVAVSSNDALKYPADAPDKMAEDAKQFGYVFPYLFDESQALAKKLRAACTPEFYVFDADGRLAYRGQFDDSRPSKDIPVTGADVRAALDALLAGNRPSEDQKPSIGCNIKWREGNAPDYF